METRSLLITSIDETKALLQLLQGQADTSINAYSLMRDCGVPLAHTSMYLARRDCHTALRLLMRTEELFYNQHMAGECNDPQCAETTVTMSQAHLKNQRVAAELLADIANDVVNAGPEDFTPVREIVLRYIGDRMQDENGIDMLSFYL